MTLLTRDQLAEYLRIKPLTVQTHAKNKRWDLIPPPIKMGGRNLWSLEVVDNWLLEKQIRVGREIEESKAKPRRNLNTASAQH